MKKVIVCAMVSVLSVAMAAQAQVIDGQAQNQEDSLGYYYGITGGKFPTGNTPNGDNGSGGTFRFLVDDPAWGSYTLGQWNKDDWFPENAGLALTLNAGGTSVYDNNGIEDGTYGDYYDAAAQGLQVSGDAPGLYRGYCMSNNYDWVYATYFKLEQTTTVDEIIGYFDANSGFDPASPLIDYRMNIWSAVQDAPGSNPNSYMPGVASFVGDVLTSDAGEASSVSGSFAWSDTGVDRVFAADYNNATDDILRLTYTLDQPFVLPAGEYFFSHDAIIVPEPASLGLVVLGCVALLRRRH